MDFTVHATRSGKRIRVEDRIGGGEVFNKFVGPDSKETVSVASNDGREGDVDIAAQMRADSPWVIIQSDYRVVADETIEVDDV